MRSSRTYLILPVIGLLTIGLVACSGKEKDTANTQMDQHQQMNGSTDHDHMTTNGNMDGTMDHDQMAMNGVEKQAGEKLIYYTCPMPAHKNVHSDQPGKCPECGMKLVETVVTDTAEAQFWGCPMPSHSHVRMEKPGDCPECGMNLKPMRLVKN
ncbi:MAG: hypothetical protein K9N34_09300 [Candidatus Marinimicrobia bacterium]|nr:hypothetical protein [Candidatus Neomarinimicrobiota bacterium]MCF7839974.1 hypothetical protein [Candidatus Neomarinimicrobiota bacterium]